MARKKILINPKSTLGIDRKSPICYNCMWRHKSDGFCPWYNEYYDYNKRCQSRKIFRYDFGIPYENMNI